MNEFKKNDDITKILLENKNNKNLSFLYFTAKWCKPCQIVYPLINNLSEKIINNKDSKYNNIIFYKVDIDIHEEFVEKCNIKAVPTFYMMDGENILGECSGINIDNIGRLIIDNLIKYNKENIKIE